MPELQRKPDALDDYSFIARAHEKEISILVLEGSAPAPDPLLSVTAHQLSGLISEQIYTEIISLKRGFSLASRLAELKAAEAQFSLVVVIADAHASHLALTEDRQTSWAEFAYQILAPFEPEYLLLLSTDKDREIPAHTFFEAVPLLREVYISAFADTKLQTDVLKFMVSYLITPAPSDYDRAFSAQIAEKLLSSGLLTRWTWRDSIKHRVLSTFELLNDTEKLAVAAEIIQRTAQSANLRLSS
jgi:hypothetical protein